MEPISYDKLATAPVSVKEKKNNRHFLRQFAGVAGRSRTAFQSAPTELELRKFALLSALGHLLVTAAGIIILSVFGITMAGALLTAWECFCTIISFAAFGWLKSQLAGYLEKNNQNFGNFFEEKVRSDFEFCFFSPLKFSFFVNFVSGILCIATIIQGAVILGQILNQNETYFYMGVVSFLYTGLGAGNMVLGVVGLFIVAFFLKKNFDFLRNFSKNDEISSPINQSINQTNNQSINQSQGSVEQLNVTDLTFFAESSLPQSPISFQSQYADTRSILSQGSDQAFFDSKSFSSEKFQPVKTIYAARTRTGSSTVTDV